MLDFSARLSRSLLNWTAPSLCAAALWASGCGDSTEGGDGGGATGGDSGADSGGSAGKGGTSGKGGSSGTAGTAGKGGTSGKGGTAGKGGTSATGGAPGGEGGAAPGGAGGEGGEGGSGSDQGPTCKAILSGAPASGTGVFTIDPPGNTEGPFQVVCDMTTEGGGWTLALIKNSTHNGHYQDFGSSYLDVAALATAPASASSSATALAGWVNLNTFPYTELRLAGYANGAQTYTSLAIQKSTLRLQFGQNGYFLYNDANGYYWCGGENAYTTNGVGQENQPTGAPADCKGHTSLGDGWDFSTGNSANSGLTVCGGGSNLMTSHPASSYFGYGSPGAAQAIWVR